MWGERGAAPMHLTERIDEVADGFEAAWKTQHQPRIEEFLKDCPAADRLALLAELIRIDAAYRRRRNETPDAAEYLGAFPELMNDAALADELKKELSEAPTMGASLETEVKPRADDRDRHVFEPRALGRFTLLEELGSGAFGTVYRAYDERLERHVAIKVLRGAAAGAEERARFLREAQNMAHLRHEAIVSVHEAGEFDGAPYLVSELIAGTDLAKLAPERLDFRRAAEIAAAIANALHYAHEQGLVHRDVAPSNILLDNAGRAFITDFGLAKRTAGASMTADGQVLGTPAYMSPEQAAGRTNQIDRRTDVYSLGAVLYELLTGERPFRGELRMLLAQVQAEEPRPPRRLDDRIPRDLETICLKAMAKEPARRYPTAGQLADDLTRFLTGEPIRARPASRAARALKSCRRHWKALLAAALAVLGAITAGVVLTATAQIEAENRRREALVERLQRVRMRERLNGWSDRALELVRQAAEIRRDADLRDFTAAALEGLDAHLVKQFENHSASSVAFDSQGKRLLLGGFHDDRGRFEDQRAQVYAIERERGIADDRLDAVGLKASGPVAFTPGGVPLQLAAGDSDTVVLYDLGADRPLHSFRIPGAGGADRDEAIRRAHPRPLLALAPDGSRIAAAARLAEDRGIVVAWDAAAGAELNRWRRVATAMAFSPDGSLLAAGDEEGRITIWSVPDGKAEFTLQAAPNEIASLAFQRNPRRDEDVEGWRGPWLLAAGDSGGTVTIWNPTAGLPVAYCRGAQHGVTAVAFNSDATLLACGAHSEVRIWDVATGRCLLRVDPNTSRTGNPLQRVAGLAFSSNGRFLAIASLGQWSPPTAMLLELQDGRGIRTYRGLSGQIARICFSPDDRHVAALSHRWEIAVWGVADGRLRRVFDAPAGDTADNAALVLSADGRRLAFSTARDARLWEIDLGRLADSWKLPRGLQDELAYAPNGELHLLRWDQEDRVCRVRRLKPGGKLELICEVHDFQRWRVKQLLLSPDASYFVAVAELAQPGTKTRNLTRAYDGVSGRRIWPPEGPEGDALEIDGLIATRSGPLPTIPTVDGRFPIYELSNGRLLSVTPPQASHVGAERRFAVGGARLIGGEHLGRSLYRFGQDEPIVTLEIDQPTAGAWPQFSLDETLVAWGHNDGSLHIADLPALQRQLARFGLGW
jgi:eukaryotic-like serine/threonine-protein kinase